MHTKSKWLLTGFILALVVFRILLGIQINFNHADYEQIYLIGLENVFSDSWSYWGPDVVWSKTRIPGALQGILVGVPIGITKSAISPIILSNLISAAGLIILGFYAKKKFPKLSIYFILGLLLLFPFGLLNGVVLLNTAYLIFTGVLLFISVCELFIYRDELLFKPSLYFFLIGFSFLFTFQLHLSWVMYIPFLFVLFYGELRRVPKEWWKPISFFMLGALLSGLSLLPTLFKYGHVMMSNAEGNLLFDISRLGSSFDLLIRYLGMATFDITNRDEVKLAMNKSTLTTGLVWAMRIYAMIQFLSIAISLFLTEKTRAYKRMLLLFLLTFIMALAMYVISNKNLDIRTYILLIPIPLWLTLHAYSYLSKFRIVKPILVGSLVLAFFTACAIGMGNRNDIYSFKAAEDRINRAIELEDPSEFGLRRESIMDAYN